LVDVMVILMIAGGKGGKGGKKRKQPTQEDAAGAAPGEADAEADAGTISGSAELADEKSGLQARYTFTLVLHCRCYRWRLVVSS
jgi:hypothetical protein